MSALELEGRWSARSSRETRREAHHSVLQNETPRHYSTREPLARLTKPRKRNNIRPKNWIAKC